MRASATQKHGRWITAGISFQTRKFKETTRVRSETSLNPLETWSGKICFGNIFKSPYRLEWKTKIVSETLQITIL
jgi:hypothetical protein